MIVNTDDAQILNPHRVGDGLKLWEIGASAKGAAAALMLSTLSARARAELGLTGLPEWAGRKVVVSGDYADPCRDNLRGRVIDHPAVQDRVRHLAEFHGIPPHAAQERLTLYDLARAMEEVSPAVISACSPLGDASPYHWAPETLDPEASVWGLVMDADERAHAAAYRELSAGPRFAVRNLDTRECFTVPQGFWKAIGTAVPGMMLVALLADGNGRGGGDLEEDPRIGTWAGARIETVLLDELDGERDITAELHALVRRELDGDTGAQALLAG